MAGPIRTRYVTKQIAAYEDHRVQYNNAYARLEVLNTEMTVQNRRFNVASAQHQNNEADLIAGMLVDLTRRRNTIILELRRHSYQLRDIEESLIARRVPLDNLVCIQWDTDYRHQIPWEVRPLVPRRN